MLALEGQERPGSIDLICSGPAPNRYMVVKLSVMAIMYFCYDSRTELYCLARCSHRTRVYRKNDRFISVLIFCDFLRCRASRHGRVHNQVVRSVTKRIEQGRKEDTMGG